MTSRSQVTDVSTQSGTKAYGVVPIWLYVTLQAQCDGSDLKLTKQCYDDHREPLLRSTYLKRLGEWTTRCALSWNAFVGVKNCDSYSKFMLFPPSNPIWSSG